MRTRATIAVGVDGSAPSILALRWAGIIAPLMGAKIRAVTAWDFEFPPGRLTPVPNPDRVAEMASSEAASKAFGEEPPSALERVIRKGTATKVLVDETLEAQLLILGSRGQGPFKGLLLGSVSTWVAEHSKCAVLIAHGTELPPFTVTQQTFSEHEVSPQKRRNGAGV
jgi:nucleotide-binding universal stress UspA family protein